MKAAREAASNPGLTVHVVYSPAPRQVQTVALQLPHGSTVGDAVRALPAGSAARAAATEPKGVGLWGRPARLDHPLRDQDRVELYRALTVDPKLARRQRFKQQGARAAGLFAHRKPGESPSSA